MRRTARASVADSWPHLLNRGNHRGPAGSRARPVRPTCSYGGVYTRPWVARAEPGMTRAGHGPVGRPVRIVRPGRPGGDGGGPAGPGPAALARDSTRDVPGRWSSLDSHSGWEGVAPAEPSQNARLYPARPEPRPPEDHETAPTAFDPMPRLNGPRPWPRPGDRRPIGRSARSRRPPRPSHIPGHAAPRAPRSRSGTSARSVACTRSSPS